ncbi:MAG: endo-1,4-beta-xylanase [Treponema sp.]|nr:endo-1,4-beta-xylanase [Treponema sp.]
MKKAAFALFAVFLLVGSCLESFDDLPDYDINAVTEDQKLWKIYEGKFLIGNIINSTYMSGDYFKYLTTHYNTVTCENDMKPSFLLRGNSWNYTWTDADNMIKKLNNNGITKIHGHTLVWHDMTPSWLYSSNAESNLKKYITEVVSHFKGKVYAWDVVNEAFPDNLSNATNWKDCLRTESNWYKQLGSGYIYLAFKTARQADPDAILYYNDYGMNGVNKPMAVYKMIEDINNQWENDPDNTNNSRKLIEGMGMQGHYGSWWIFGNRDGTPHFNLIKTNMRRFLSLGIRLDISELDIEDKDINGNYGTGSNTRMSEATMNDQARAYARLFKLLLDLEEEFPDQITRVTMWGIDDRNSWKSRGNPCLFGGSLKAKPAFWAVSNPNDPAYN